MEGFTIIDGVVAGIIVISAILAYARGFVREVMSILGWVVAAVVAFIFAPTVLPLVREIPYIGGFIGESCELGVIFSFAAVFAVALVIVSLFTPLFSGVIQRSAVGGVDAGLGFFFGVARGILLVVVALIAYERVVGNEGIEMVDNSRSVQVFGSFQGNVEEQIPSDAPGWILARYEQLTSVCAAPADDAPAQ
jgi:membrane protein required for colicin V production